MASLRARSGLHAEVARLGEHAGSAARAEAKARHDLALAEEKLGKALLRLRAAGVDDAEVPTEAFRDEPFTSPAHAADHARRLGSMAVHGGSGGGLAAARDATAAVLGGGGGPGGGGDVFADATRP